MCFGAGLALFFYAKLKEFQARRPEVQDVNVRTLSATRILYVRIFGGFLLMVPKKELIYLDVTFEQASKFIVSAGTSDIN